MNDNKSGIGVGSASIVLVFAVLCLTVFSLISMIIAKNNKVLADTEAQLVTRYYYANAQAERILADIIESGSFMPETLDGIEILTSWAVELETDVAVYLCRISDEKELYIKLAIYEDAVYVMNWQMLDIGEWEYDGSLGVWIGDSFDELWMLDIH